MLERSSALAPGDEVRRRDHVPAGAAAVGFPHRHDPAGLTVRQRLQHHGAHDAEDRRGRADAEGQRHQRRCGEARRPSQHASAMADIANRVFEQRRPDFIPCALFDAVHPAELAQRLASGLVRIHPSAPVLLGLLIDVKTNLFVETSLERVAPADGAEPFPAVGYPSHRASQLFRLASSTASNGGLVRPQRVDRRHAHAATGRHIRRDRGDDEQDHRGEGERPRIEWFGFVQQAQQQASQRTRRDQPNHHADRHQAQRAPDARGGTPTRRSRPAPCGRRFPACVPAPSTPSRRRRRSRRARAPRSRTRRRARRSRVVAQSWCPPHLRASER